MTTPLHKDPRIGKQVGGTGYYLREKLGEGGYGTVYRATHEKLDQCWAVKILDAAQSKHPEVIRRFENEARVECIIDHENVVKVRELGKLATGDYFIAMDYLDGASLHEVITENPQPRDLRGPLQVFVQICAGLEAAHSIGVIHRDLKPKNVIVKREGPRAHLWRVWVVDFGIARIVDKSRSRGVNTETGIVGGTVEYMPPEMARGAKYATEQSDIYALGAIFYRWFAARTPYQTSNLYELGQRQSAGPVPSVRESAPWLPDEWVQLVDEMLDRDPSERPETVRDCAIRAVGATPSGDALAFAAAQQFYQDALVRPTTSTGLTTKHPMPVVAALVANPPTMRHQTSDSAPIATPHEETRKVDSKPHHAEASGSEAETMPMSSSSEAATAPLSADEDMPPVPRTTTTATLAPATVNLGLPPVLQSSTETPRRSRLLTAGAVVVGLALAGYITLHYMRRDTPRDDAEPEKSGSHDRERANRSEHPGGWPLRGEVTCHDRVGRRPARGVASGSQRA